MNLRGTINKGNSSMKRGSVEQQEDETPKGFNLQVTYRDEQTGLNVKSDPYILRVCGAGGDRTQLFERPKGSGNCFDKQNNPIGRWVKDEKGKGKHDPAAAHVAYVAPLTGDAKLHAEMVESKERITELERELKAMAAEKAKAEAAAKKVTGA
jgi:hypothetical protein